MKTKQNKPKARGAKSTNSQIQRLESRMKSMNTNRTPFRDTGGIIGKRVGNMFGVDGSSIGRWLGTGIGSIFGSGDYTISGQTPGYNVLTASSQTPQFTTTQHANIVCHREYLGDIVGTSSFNVNQYPLNPGLSGTFPWLSTIAQNYQEYRFHGLVFEFRPLITDFVTSGAPGVVVMATNYNADLPAYTSKQQMENSEFATSVKPTVGLMHAVECAVPLTTLPHRYVRTSVPATGQDLRLYDQGTFQFATQANPIVDLGELWVTYCVEFMKPTLPSTIGGTVSSQHIQRSSNSTSSPLGLIGLFNLGSLGVTATSTTLSFTANPTTKYLFVVTYIGTSVTSTNPSFTYSTGLTALNYFNNGSFASVVCPTSGTTTQMSYTIALSCTLLNPGVVTITAPAGTVQPIGVVDMFITELDSTVTD